MKSVINKKIFYILYFAVFLTIIFAVYLVDALKDNLFKEIAYDLDKKIAITRDSSGKSIIVKLKEEESKKQVLKEHEIKQLTDYALKLEKHFKKAQDIEFAIEQNEIYIVQTRPITTLEKRKEKGEKAIFEGKELVTGIPASPGIASGKVKKLVKPVSRESYNYTRNKMLVDFLLAF